MDADRNRLVLCHNFKILCFIREAICSSRVATIRGTETGCVIGLGVLCCQVNVVSIVFQTTGINRCTVTATVHANSILISSTFRRRDSTTDTKASADIIGHRSAVTVAILGQQATTTYVFTAYAAVFTLVLQGQIQAIHQTEEVGVAVGRQALARLVIKLSVWAEESPPNSGNISVQASTSYRAPRLRP